MASAITSTGKIPGSKSNDDIDSVKHVDLDDDDKKAKRKDSNSKTIFSKKDSKEKGYSALSMSKSTTQESLFLANSKSKKTKSETKISLFSKKSTKDDKKKSKKDFSLFGNTLEKSVELYPCNDGILIAYPIRICIDIIDEKGIDLEGIYKKQADKTHLREIRNLIDSRDDETYIEDLKANPYLAAGIIKKYLSDLKTPLLNDEMITALELISEKNIDHKIELINNVLDKLPPANRDLFSCLIIHLTNISQKSDVNKMDLSTIIITFQPLIKLKDKLLKFILKNSNLIFKNLRFKKYRNKYLTNNNDNLSSRLSLLPDNIQELEAEIAKKELIITELHSKIAKNNEDKKLQEQLLEDLWTNQRYVTSMKREIKKLRADKQKNLNNDSLIIQTPQIQLPTKQDASQQQQQQQQKKQEQLNDKYEKLLNEDLMILCENQVLIENMKYLFEKLNKEKIKIFDLQQQLNILQPLNYDDTYETLTAITNINELKLLNEQLELDNKTIDESINQLKLKINDEKDKIYQLKIKIQFETLKITL